MWQGLRLRSHINLLRLLNEPFGCRLSAFAELGYNIRFNCNSNQRTMDKTPKNAGETISATPSIDLLTQRLGTAPAPRMLTEYENELLRRSAHEIYKVTAEVLRRKE